MADIEHTCLSRKCKACGTPVGKGKQYCEPCRPSNYVKVQVRVGQCETCGKEYTTNLDHQKFCSLLCARNFRNKKVRQCKSCGTDVEKGKHRCDRCLKNHRSKSLVKSEQSLLSVVCVNCGNNFETYNKRRKYCSSLCSTQYWQKNNQDAYQASKKNYEEKRKQGKPIKHHVKSEKNKRSYADGPYYPVQFKKCVQCNTSFIARNNKQTLFCETCRKNKYCLAEREKEEFYECKVCGVKYSPLPGSGRELRSTCSAECRHIFVSDGKFNSHHYRRVAKKSGVDLCGSKAKFSRMEIFERDRWVCKLCGKKVNGELSHCHPMSATLDHIVPVSLGGLHVRENVQLAHKICNMSKGNRSIKHEQLLLIG